MPDRPPPGYGYSINEYHDGYSIHEHHEVPDDGVEAMLMDVASYDDYFVDYN